MVIKRMAPMSPSTEKWLKETRETIGSKFYDVDPFDEVFKMRDNVYSIMHESADGRAEVWTHVVVGSEKALVVDTGFGVGNLRGLVEELAPGRELIVVNTHPHIDHAYGNCQFDRVYCHEFCAPMLHKQDDPTIWDELVDENGDGIWIKMRKEDIIPYKKYEIVPCANNTVFDLGGGHEIELIWSPGHAAGGAVYLDKKNRILFSGDSFGHNIGMVGASPQHRLERVVHNEYMCIESFRDETAKLAARVDEFDYAFAGHDILDIEAKVVTDMFDILNDIVADPNCQDEKSLNVHKIEVKIKRKGVTGVMYQDARVYFKKPQE